MSFVIDVNEWSAMCRFYSLSTPRHQSAVYSLMLIEQPSLFFCLINKIKQMKPKHLLGFLMNRYVVTYLWSTVHVSALRWIFPTFIYLFIIYLSIYLFIHLPIYFTYYSAQRNVTIKFKIFLFSRKIPAKKLFFPWPFFFLLAL